MDIDSLFQVNSVRKSFETIKSKLIKDAKSSQSKKDYIVKSKVEIDKIES
jgi:hypothetical protein